MIDPIDQTTTAQEQSAQHQFFHGIGIRAGCIEYGNAEFCHSRYGNVVGAGSAAGDGADRDVDFGFLEFVRTEEDGVGVVFGVVFGDFVVRGWETF
jgi:hypothetical protein